MRQECTPLGIRTSNLPRTPLLFAGLCLMATGLIACGGGDGNHDDDARFVLDTAVLDTLEAAHDTSVSGDYTTYEELGVNFDGSQIDVPGDNDLGVGTDAIFDDASPGELAWLADNALLDGYSGDWYVYDPGTPMVSVYAEFPTFSWSQTCSAVGEPIPPVLVQISHVPVIDLQDWIDAISASIKLTRLSDDVQIPATVTPVEVPICRDGGCRNPGMAVYNVEVTPDDPIADDWYRIGMDTAPALVASAVDPNKTLRFNPGHDARVGMIRYQAQAGYDNQGSFRIIFTEMLHSPALADFPTLRVAQGAVSSLACDFYTDETMWLGLGQPQFSVRSCAGLDITKSFKIYLGGILMTADGKALPRDEGQYQVEVQPANWGAPCIGIWSCNEIPIQ